MSKQTFNSEEELREHVAYVIKEAQLRFKTAPESPSGVVGIASGMPKGSRCARGSKLFSITFKDMQYQNTHIILMLENPSLYTALCVHNYHNPESPYVVGRKSTSMMHPNSIGNLVVCPLDVLIAYQKGCITENELIAKSMGGEHQESPVEAEEIQQEPVEPLIDLQSMSVSQLRAYLDSLGFTVGDITINHNHPIMQ